MVLSGKHVIYDTIFPSRGGGVNGSRMGTEGRGCGFVSQTDGAPSDTPITPRTPIKLGSNVWQVGVVLASGEVM